MQLDIGGVKDDLVKDEKGVWKGESAPQVEGFHYQLNVDSASVPDPGTLSFYGAGRLGSSGIEIPTRGRFASTNNHPFLLFSA